MALTNQPYLPLYVDDWMNNTKLKQCSAGAHGLMISIMCLMHKEETYGKILLRQKFKQTDKQISNFALFFAKVTPFDLPEIEKYLEELFNEKILHFEEEFIVCPRMVRDFEISLIRSKSGGKGGKATKKKFAIAKIEAKNKAKYIANTVNENENTNGTIVKGVKGETEGVLFDNPVHKLQEFCKTLPEVQKLRTQLTYHEANELEKLYGMDVVKEVLLAMENFKNLLKNYKSVYLTCNNWCKRRKSNPQNTKGAKSWLS